MKKLNLVFLVGFFLFRSLDLLAQENINREILPIVPPEPQTYTLPASSEQDGNNIKLKINYYEL